MNIFVVNRLVIKSVVSTALLAAAGVTMAQTGPANAFGVVISSTPVVQQVTVPRQVCTTTTVQNVQPNGGGALVGALVGGVIGNQIGRGQHSDGRAAATVIGALGGGLVGNHVETTSYPTQTCKVQNTIENQTVAQTIVYEYVGQRYSVQMPAHGDFRPGTQIALHVAEPVQAVAPVQTVTYTRPRTVYVTAPPVVFYSGHDNFEPRYIRSDSYYAPRAIRHPVHPPRHGRQEHQNWR